MTGTLSCGLFLTGREAVFKNPFSKHIGFDHLSYWDCVGYAQDAPWNVNHAGWILHEDEKIKYVLSTLNEGLSFCISFWNQGENIGKIVREVHSPSNE